MNEPQKKKSGGLGREINFSRKCDNNIHPNTSNNGMDGI